MPRALLMLLAAVLALNGCATVPPSPLTLASAKALHLEAINVEVAPDASIMWGNAQDEYVRERQAKGDLPKRKIIETASIGPGNAAGPDDSIYQELVQSAEGQAFVKEKVANRLVAALDQHVKADMSGGSQPVKLEITVHTFIVPSAVQRVVLGGAPVISASAVLKDARTGAVIAERPQMAAAAMAGNGWGGVLADQFFDDLDVRLVNSYAQQYRDWLIPKG